MGARYEELRSRLIAEVEVKARAETIGEFLKEQWGLRDIDEAALIALAKFTDRLAESGPGHLVLTVHSSELGELSETQLDLYSEPKMLVMQSLIKISGAVKKGKIKSPEVYTRAAGSLTDVKNMVFREGGALGDRVVFFSENSTAWVNKDGVFSILADRIM